MENDVLLEVNRINIPNLTRISSSQSLFLQIVVVDGQTPKIQSFLSSYGDTLQTRCILGTFSYTQTLDPDLMTQGTFVPIKASRMWMSSLLKQCLPSVTTPKPSSSGGLSCKGVEKKRIGLSPGSWFHAQNLTTQSSVGG